MSKTNEPKLDSYKGIRVLKDWILVKVSPKATSDIILLDDGNNPKVELSDIEVMCVGPDVTNVKIGDYILCRPGIPFINVKTLKDKNDKIKYGLIDAFTVIAIDETKTVDTSKN